jgi:hypothetical protein
MTETGEPSSNAGAHPEPVTEPEQTAPPTGADAGKGNEVVRWIVGVVANVAVLTALLVYFGWQRSKVQAARLGINESILGISTRDYMLRSVWAVLVLLVVIGVGGLLWLRWDDWLVRRLRRDSQDRVVRYTLRSLPFSWLVLPAIVWAAGFVWPALAFVAWPFSFGVGVLLLLYAAQLRGMLPDAEAPAPGRLPLLRGFTAIIVGITLFWGASNYATLQGDQLADKTAGHIHNLMQVVVYSPQRLHLTAPGVTETPLAGDKSAYRYRYAGLRLLTHTGGHYFLLSDGWTPRFGVVMVVADDDPVRLEFINDRRE